MIRCGVFNQLVKNGARYPGIKTGADIHIRHLNTTAWFGAQFQNMVRPQRHDIAHISDQVDAILPNVIINNDKGDIIHRDRITGFGRAEPMLAILIHAQPLIGEKFGQGRSFNLPRRHETSARHNQSGKAGVSGSFSVGCIAWPVCKTTYS